jgi:hypothetical protein
LVKEGEEGSSVVVGGGEAAGRITVDSTIIEDLIELELGCKGRCIVEDARMFSYIGRGLIVRGVGQLE